MSARWRQLLLTLGLLLLFGGSTWWVYRFEESGEDARQSAVEIPADYLMHGVTTLKFDVTGRKREQLQAAALRHYPGGEIELDAPELVLFAEEYPLWHLHSEYGRISPHGDVLWFLGKARFQRHTLDGATDLEILSRDVRVEPQRGYAETDAPATLLSAHGELHGTGLRAWAQERRFELLSQVQGRYAGW